MRLIHVNTAAYMINYCTMECIQMHISNDK